MKALAVLSLLSAICAGLLVGVAKTAAPGPCPAGDTMISITASRYDPSAITVAPGTTVCWTNRDPIQHTVSFTDGPDSGLLGQNEIFRRTFTAEGTFSYVCIVPTHLMSGSVVVSSAPPPPPPPGPPPPGPPPPPQPPPPPSPPPPSGTTRVTVSGYRVRVERKNGRRWVVARARLNRAAASELRLLRRTKTMARMRKALRRGPNILRLRVPARIQRGRYTARLTVAGRRYTTSLRL